MVFPRENNQLPSAKQPALKTYIEVTLYGQSQLYLGILHPSLFLVGVEGGGREEQWCWAFNPGSDHAKPALSQSPPFSEIAELKTSEKKRKEKASKINVSLAKSGLRLIMKSLNYSHTFL